MEEELGRVLTELYERLVPSEQRVEIAEKLAREEQHEAEERVRHEAETYRVSVLKLTAGRACEYQNGWPKITSGPGATRVIWCSLHLTRTAPWQK